MPNELITALQEAFAESYTIQDLAKLYAEIHTECEKLLNCTAEQIKKELVDNAERRCCKC